MRDALGDITNHVDTAGRTNCYTYLPTRILSSVTRQLGTSNITTSISYDNQFNTLKIADAKGRAVETYLLDIQDRVTSVTNLEGQTMSATYGVGSYLRKLSRFDGTTVTNTFNSGGFLLNMKYPGTTNSFTYTKAGRFLTLSNEIAVISNSWQQTGWLNSSATAFKSGPTTTVAYAYFPAGNLSNVTSVAGTNTYSFDEAERLSTLTAQRPQVPPLAFNYSYNANNGRVAAVTCTNTGISVNYAYDNVDELIGITWGTTNSTLLNFQNTFNDAGMITGIAREDGENYQYSYDDLDRLTNSTCLAADGTISSGENFAYDEVGNRTSKITSGITLSYSYSNGCNRLSNWAITQTNLGATVYVSGCANEPVGTNPRYGQLWVSNKTAITPFVDGTNFCVYDLPMNLGTQKIVAAIRDMAGNTTFKTNTVVLSIVTNGAYSYSPAGCVTNIRYTGSAYTKNIALTFDGAYHVTALATNGFQCECNGFDAVGRRVWSWDGTATNYFVYDGRQIIADLNQTGGLVRSYVWGPGIDNLLAITVHTGATVKVYFALTDHLRTVHALADTNGVIVESYRLRCVGQDNGL